SIASRGLAKTTPSPEIRENFNAKRPSRNSDTGIVTLPSEWVHCDIAAASFASSRAANVRFGSKADMAA
ncbi:MAG TPA: hypothetical protein VK690_04980, partial [Stellaceae bacterium]|nr:hypothetical protein [Stellaceae bacterium]